jgi:glycosyltransferase involved in cell wall biosynthesis
MRKKLLMLLPFPPIPDGHHGGAKSSGQLLERLAERHETGLLYFRQSGEQTAPRELLERCRFAVEVRRAGAREGVSRFFRNLQLAACSLAQRAPMWAADWRDGEFQQRARQIAAEWKPDIIQAHFHMIGQYLERTRTGPRTVLVEHEPGTPAAADRCRMHRGLRGFIYKRDLIAWERFERSVLRNADAVVAFTAKDASALRRMAPEAHIEVLPSGTVAPARADHRDSGTELLFIGNYVHPPNVDAALRLARAIFPAVLREVPEARLVLAGANPPAAVRALGGEAVTVPGFVPNLAPLVDRAAVVPVPLRYGGGMRVKVLEALAAGKAVVASRTAVDGIAVRDGEQVLMAETDAEFAEAIRSLLTDPVRRAGLCSRARDWAVGNLGWERTIAGYDALYESLLSTGRG